MTRILATLALTLLTWTPVAAGTLRCVQGSLRPPSSCDTYPDLYTALAAASFTDEVKVYGNTEIPTPVTLTVRKLTGVRAVLDARPNPGVALLVTGADVTDDGDEESGYKIEDLKILTPGTAGSVGIQFSQLGIVTMSTVSVQGCPPSSVPGVLCARGGLGVGIDILPGTGRVTHYGNTGLSEMRGLAIGHQATDHKGRFSPDRVQYRDVQVGLKMTGFNFGGNDKSGQGQLFRLNIACERTDSVGIDHTSPVSNDHSQVTITGCSVGIKLSCRPGYGCGGSSFAPGGGNAYDKVAVNTVPCANQPDQCGIILPCVTVRNVLEDGSVVDGYQSDPVCGDVWRTPIFDNVEQATFRVACPRL